MRQTFLVTRNGEEHLRLVCEGSPARCRHRSSGPGAREYERLLGNVLVPLWGGVCSADARLYPVLTRTARLAFPAEEGFEVLTQAEPLVRARRA